MANPKDLPRDIGGFIRDLRRSAKISLRQLAQQAGVSNPYLSQIERGLRKPSAEVLQQLASALRVSTPVMYLRAGLLDDREGQGVLAAIAADPDLTMPQKQSLSQIYETFRRENLRNADPEADRHAAGAPATGPGATAPTATGSGDVVGESPADAVLESVAVTETGAAAPPPTTPSGSNDEPTSTGAPAKRTARKAAAQAPSAPPAASAPDEEK
ncbi:helix-turn-helix domain-containing protein [Micromonospora sp. HM5-17]|jgi:transcriptional regulator with XRE-family HTH domain|uniref:helix-turn-helix domain-containing protein n=1 Tax=Micromonospora sp. HM5-17 TaxID=2487710 RepID=UPI000F48641D|nr:helix-turn-helix domain-containing protein [Micromonospora sp. HM5-17]ROT31921.1 helix-turn-helix domain-containing protein [Micromonospora sp. HM5-17]